jgi:surface antigen
MRAGRIIAVLFGILIPCTASVAAEAQAPYEASIQYALERLTSGITANSQVGEVAVTVKPVRTWKSVSGHYCREYEITIANPDTTSDQDAGIRCRDSDGIWKQVK